MSPKEEPAPSLGVATVLSAGTRAVGELHSKEDLVLVGSFEGRLFVDRALRIMPEAHVEGEVHAERILVLGHMQGRLLAQQRIEIKAGAVVSGEVMAPQIRIHEGVLLNAKVHMGPASVAGPAAAPAAAAASGPAARLAAVAAPGPVAAATPGTPAGPSARSGAAPEMMAAWGAGPGVAVGAAPVGPSRHYLLPTLLRSLGDAPYEDIEHAERATENFLRGLGFELETRAARPDRTGSLRPIFRSAEAVPYATLRERLQRVEHALRAAASESPEPPLQGTGSAGAREVVMALARLRRAALVVGPVALVRRDENPGNLHLAVRARPPWPETGTGDSPDPASLLLSLQKMQHELLDDLG